MATISRSVRAVIEGAPSVAGSLASAPLLRLLWLSSPALPIGAYAYSRGLEQAVTRGWVSDEASLLRWILGVLTRQLATLDAPVMLRVLVATRAHDGHAVTTWNDFLRANRESRELALEDEQLGAALSRVLRDVHGLDAAAFPSKVSQAAAFGIACAHFRVPEAAAAGAYLFAFAESQVTAALKCLVLGQTSGQRVLAALLGHVESLTTAVLTREDDALGSFAPGLSMASALHETQYSRLFRS